MRSRSVTRIQPVAARAMALTHLLFLAAVALADPAPGRVPKVYNALITSNQNLEPSKAYPVYQPVLHDPFALPFQHSLFYGGEFPLSNGLLPPSIPTKDPAGTPLLPSTPQPSEQPPQQPPQQPPSQPEASDRSEASAAPVDPAPSAATSPGVTPPPPPPPPNTESPIPLNQFGLPAQVLPLGGINPAYNGYNQIGPFTYSYPSYRFYDPFDPFSLNPYANLPALYRPLPNGLGQSIPLQSIDTSRQLPPETPAPPPSEQPSPPPEPGNLNVLNYANTDPAIPNVPPPPLPQGGLKSDKTE